MYTNAERLFHRVLTQGRVPGPPAVNLEKISYFEFPLNNGFQPLQHSLKSCVIKYNKNI